MATNITHLAKCQTRGANSFVPKSFVTNKHGNSVVRFDIEDLHTCKLPLYPST